MIQTRYTVKDYEELPEGSPYQLIGGELVMSPSPGFEHQQSLINILIKLHSFLKQRAKGRVLIAPFDLYLDELNAYQPDIMVILKGSKAKITSKGVYGAPDIVVEVLSPSTAYYDMKVKKRVYEKAGVREYWIVDPMEKSVEVYKNSYEGFVLHSKATEKGSFSSEILGVQIDLSEVFEEV